MTVENPFAVYSPEQLTPKDFEKLFVKEHTWINALETPKDFFINGSRGSGKSMLLNYLEFSHQLYYFKNSLKNFFEQERRHKYIGIMVHVTKKELNTSRYELLLRNNFDERGVIEELCMSDLVMAILYEILKTFVEVTEMARYINNLDTQRVKNFCEREIRDLDQQNIHKLRLEQNHTNTDLLQKVADVFLQERVSIKYYANEKFQMRKTMYKGNYSSFAYMKKFLDRIKKLVGIDDYSFYILMDNGDEVKNMMQLCIDQLISQREHRDVCIKVAVKKGIYWNKGTIQWPHDYSQIDIDELYSTEHTVYYRRIKEIANKRLKLAGIDVVIEDFLLESRSEKKLLREIKKEFREKYEKEYAEKYLKIAAKDRPRKTDFISNRVNKYAQAELFRRLKKTGKSYAGFDNIVQLSSGIIRRFLDIASYMFDEEKMKKKGGKITQIKLKTQNSVIKNYADDFMDELEKKYKALEKEEATRKEAKDYKNLFTLIEALGEYYKERLMSAQLKEPRVFTFTLKDRGADPRIDKILDIGVNENYFQSYWYSSKRGIGKYRAYSFNRRLCPRYAIDHTSFRGRIELTTAELESAIKKRKMPKSAYRDEGYPTLDLFTEAS